ncbi:branched-chain amino acid ABC transporter permease [Nocardioides litoris]|uniref:branched-chain amino acid ABC transporter permease n=1 Tax=Nocardioides litoris TaxID=1926648 RepID=UPI0014769BC2|nr:branched-chain amino acid ABC transporter permease [Nocardioides litoris]
MSTTLPPKTEDGSSPVAPATPTDRRAKRTRLWGRPAFFQSYEQQLALFDTWSKRVGVAVVVVVGFALTQVFSDDILRSLALAFVLAIAALGLNMVTGLAGQVSLGHAFFIGIGAYTAAAISGDPEARTIGYGIEEMWIWLPAAGLVAAVFGVIVAPIATRLRGLYLAIVTLGLVFLGEHVFREWSSLTGGAGVGRSAAEPVLFGFDFSDAGSDSMFTRDQQMYVLMLVLLLVFALAARNIGRSKVGRSFAAVRDRDMAAEMMGIDLPRTKTLAFALSSFYAGCAGGLLYTITGYFDPGSFNLLLSVQIIAMVLIGGAGTVSGTIAGALFVAMLPTIVRNLVAPNLTFISTLPSETPNVFQVEQILYGLLIVVFLLFEPRGLFGIWVRFRTYWKSWPFSY